MQRDLVVRAQAGDVDAFATLAEGAATRLYPVARLILRDDERARDAVQDALLKSWTDLRGLRDPERFDGWLYRLLVRACYRTARRTRTREVLELRVAIDSDHSSPDALRAVAVRDKLERGFRRMSTDTRAVVVLRHYVGLLLEV